MYENLKFHNGPQPAAITLHYSIKNIRNDVPQITYIYEKSQFNSLVWGSLTLAPVINILSLYPQTTQTVLPKEVTNIFKANAYKTWLRRD